MNLRMRMSFAALSLCVLTAGCANLNSIYRDEDVDHDSKVLLIDAKQRAILTTMRPVKVKADHSGYVESYRAFCAEPSPDVFTVLSQAANGSASFGQSADSINAAAQLAISSAESGATISRTQTINMLREMMYRTCERYLSGALGPLEFSTQAIRDQRIMVSILAIEQLTGAVTPRAVALSSGGSASAGQLSNDVLVRLDDSWKALQTANQNLSSKKAELAALDASDASPPPPTCGALADKAKNSPNSLTPDETAKNTKCVAAQKLVIDAQTAQQNAQKHYDEMAKLAADGGGSSSTSASGQILSGGGQGGLDQASNANMATVAGAVKDIVVATFDQDEYQLFCLRELDSGVSHDPKIAQACQDYLQKSVEFQAARIDRLTAEEKARESKLLDEAAASDFEMFWRKVAGDSNTSDPAKVKAATDKVSPEWPSWQKIFGKMNAKLTKEQMKALFGRLPPEVENLLAK